MNWDLIKPLAGQAARDVLRFVGMYLMAKGVISNQADLAAFVGAGMTVSGLFWGWFTTIGFVKLQKMFAAAVATPAKPSSAVSP